MDAGNVLLHSSDPAELCDMPCKGYLVCRYDGIADGTAACLAGGSDNEQMRELSSVYACHDLISKRWDIHGCSAVYWRSRSAGGGDLLGLF